MNTFRLKTLNLLRERDKSIRFEHIANATGLSLCWLKKFHTKGEQLNSGVDFVICLYEYLTGKKLKF